MILFCMQISKREMLRNFHKWAHCEQTFGVLYRCALLGSKRSLVSGDEITWRTPLIQCVLVCYAWSPMRTLVYSARIIVDAFASCECFGNCCCTSFDIHIYHTNIFHKHAYLRGTYIYLLKLQWLLASER